MLGITIYINPNLKDKNQTRLKNNPSRAFVDKARTLWYPEVGNERNGGSRRNLVSLFKYKRMQSLKLTLVEIEDHAPY